MPTSPGLHHVTAICSDAPRTRDFYERVLGLRLVKRTVNFDDPGTWHLYFGDETGGPGSVLTFFEWPTAEAGKPGAGQAVALSLAIPKGAAHGWVQRLTEEDIFVAIAPGADDALTFFDPDGLALELIEQDWAETLPGHVTAYIGEEQAIRGLAVVTLLVEDCDATASVLEDALGWRECARASHGGFLRLRFQAPGEAGPGRLIDVLKAPEAAFRLSCIRLCRPISHQSTKVSKTKPKIRPKDATISERLAGLVSESPPCAIKSPDTSPINTTLQIVCKMISAETFQISGALKTFVFTICIALLLGAVTQRH